MGKSMIIDTWTATLFMLGVVSIYLAMVYTILYLVELLHRKEPKDFDH